MKPLAAIVASLMLVSTVDATPQHHSAEAKGWNAMLYSCINFLGYGLGAPVACYYIAESDRDGRIKLTGCIAAAMFTLGQGVDCGCAICRVTPSNCTWC